MLIRFRHLMHLIVGQLLYKPYKRNKILSYCFFICKQASLDSAKRKTDPYKLLFKQQLI